MTRPPETGRHIRMIGYNAAHPGGLLIITGGWFANLQELRFYTRMAMRNHDLDRIEVWERLTGKLLYTRQRWKGEKS